MKATSKEIKEFLEQYLQMRELKAKVEVSFDPDIGHDIVIIQNWKKDMGTIFNLIYEIKDAIIKEFGDRLMTDIDLFGGQGKPKEYEFSVLLKNEN